MAIFVVTLPSNRQMKGEKKRLPPWHRYHSSHDGDATVYRHPTPPVSSRCDACGPPLRPTTRVLTTATRRMPWGSILSPAPAPHPMVLRQ